MSDNNSETSKPEMEEPSTRSDKFFTGIATSTGLTQTITQIWNKTPRPAALLPKKKKRRKVKKDETKRGGIKRVAQLAVPHGSSSDSDFEVLNAPSKPKVTPVKSAAKREDRMKVSVPDLAQIGDIVTSTAKELNHPRYRFGDVPPGYIFFGVVEGESLDMVKVKWNKVEHRLRTAKIVKKRSVADSEVFNTIDYVSRAIVRVVAKFDDGGTRGLNTFLRAALYHEFYYQPVGEEKGWMMYDWV